jgi:hypothetical protein
MQMGDTIAAVATAIVGVALVAVIVSRNAQTPQVIAAGGGAFSQALRAATGPVTGGSGYSGLRGLTSYGGYGVDTY